MNNLLMSYCGLVHAKIRASDKDLPVIEKSHEIFLANISRKIAKLLKRNWDAHGFESLDFLVTYLNLFNYLLYEKFIID